MKCAKCSLDLPPGVKACPKCGLVNEFLEEISTPPRKTKPMVYVIAGLAAVVVLALVVGVIAARGNKNVTSAPGGVPPPPGNLTSAPSGQLPGGNVVTAPSGQPAPPAATPPGVTKPKPLKEVVDYLEFVKRVEAHRQMLLKDTVNALTLAASGGGTQGLLDLIDMAMDPEGKEARDPLAETKAELSRQYKNWLSTLRFFDRRVAPPECREFSGAYRDVLFRETKAIGEITVSFNSVNVMDPKDMSRLLDSLQKMKRDPSIQRNIDQAADNADAKLTRLVSNYDMEKPFSVQREQSTSGSIMGF